MRSTKNSGPVLEQAHQIAFFQWAHMARGAHPELKELYAIPNGGLRNKVVAAKLVAEGVKKGRPDISLDVACGPYHGWRAEMKRPASEGRRKGVASDEQLDVIANLRKRGYYAAVVYGWEEAKDSVLAYLALGPFSPTSPGIP